MRTRFGKLGAMHRADRRLLLSEFAQRAGFAKAFVSNLEHGRENVSDAVIGAYIEVLNLNGAAAYELRQSARASNQLRLELKAGKTEKEARLASMLAIFGKDVRPEILDAMIEAIEKETGYAADALFLQPTKATKKNAGQRAFVRRAMLPKRLAQICWIALILRRRLFLDQEVFQPTIMLDYIASLGIQFDYDVLDEFPKEHSDKFAYVAVESGTLTLFVREKFLNRLSGAYGRYVIAHEIAHFCIHQRVLLTSKVGSTVLAPPKSQLEEGDILTDQVPHPLEVEADFFAVALLVPWESFLKGTSLRHICKDFFASEGKVKEFVRLFDHKSVRDELRHILWGIGEKDHFLFDDGGDW